jgi:dUTP pyrophosphatase
MANTKLYIKTNNDLLEQKYSNHGYFNNGDSGLDLFTPKDIEIKCGETKLIDFEIKCEMKTDEKNVSYYLYPRSSIHKTPLIMANSVGIIDAGYRGKLMAPIKYVPNSDDLLQLPTINTYKIEAGTRLFQICSPNLEPFNYELIDELSLTERGESGFGSTGK